MFHMMVEKVITPNIRKVRRSQDRKLAGVFAADILTKGQVPPTLWGALLEEVIALFELPVDEGEDEDDQPHAAEGECPFLLLEIL